MVDDDDAAGAEGLGAVSDVRWDHSGLSRAQTLLLLIDDQQDLPLDHVPDLFLRMIVLVQVGGSFGDLPVAEGHVLRRHAAKATPGEG